MPGCLPQLTLVSARAHGQADYLVSLPEEEFPQTIDFLKVVDCIGRTYANLFAKIYEENPAVMDRLIKIPENAEEDLKQNIKQGFKPL